MKCKRAWRVGGDAKQAEKQQQTQVGAVIDANSAARKINSNNNKKDSL